MNNIRETSTISLHQVRNDGTADTQRQIVFDDVKKYGNVTNREVESRLEMSISSVTARMNELVNKHGTVIALPKRHCAITGKLVTAWGVKKWD